MTVPTNVEHVWTALTLLFVTLKGILTVKNLFDKLWAFFVALIAGAIALKMGDVADETKDEATAKANLDAAMASTFDQAAAALGLPGATVMGLKAVESMLSGAAVKWAESAVAQVIPPQ